MIAYIRAIKDMDARDSTNGLIGDSNIKDNVVTMHSSRM